MTPRPRCGAPAETRLRGAMLASPGRKDPRLVQTDPGNSRDTLSAAQDDARRPAAAPARPPDPRVIRTRLLALASQMEAYARELRDQAAEWHPGPDPPTGHQ